jgi:biotin carboxyl carrier protein
MARLMRESRWAIRIADTTVEVTLAGDRLVANGLEVVVAELGDGEWLVRGASSSARLFVAGPPDAPWIWHDGVAYRPEVVDPRAREPRRREASGDLSAPMPATVRAIHGAEGDAVSRGDTLVVLEAMKMELPLKAPADGVIAEIACRVGELVQPGVPLVKLR